MFSRNGQRDATPRWLSLKYHFTAGGLSLTEQGFPGTGARKTDGTGRQRTALCDVHKPVGCYFPSRAYSVPTSGQAHSGRWPLTATLPDEQASAAQLLAKNSCPVNESK